MNKKAIALPFMLICLLVFLGGCGEETIERPPDDDL